MELFHMRRRTGAVLFIILLFSAAVLVSCRGGGAGSSTKKDTVSFLQPFMMKTSSGDGQLYDITELLSGQDGTLCTYGFYDETHLLLIRSDSTGERRAVSGYTAQLLDLSSGDIRDLLSFDRAGSLKEDSDGTQGLDIISSDPLVVHDRTNGVLYRPGSQAGSLVLPEWLSDSAPYWFAGRLWLSSDRGIIYEVTEEGRIDKAWTLPCTYSAFCPVVAGHDGMLSFTACSLLDPSTRIFVDVDPVSGESRFYYSDLNPARFSSFSGGRLLGSSFRTAPEISVCDPADHTCRKTELPEQVLDLLEGRTLVASSQNDGGYAAFRTVPLSLCSDWCTWMLCDDSDRPVCVYLWDTASCRSSAWSGPSESEYSAPEQADYEEISRIADDLSSKYTIRIVIGNNIPKEFADYSAESVEDDRLIRDSLTVLDNVLSLYPDGYFASLKGNYYRDIVLYLTGTLQPLNADTNISNAGAFATESGGLMQIAFDLYDDLSPSTVIHELTHAADYRFAGEQLLDEEAWNSMNPRGFSYYLSYIDENGESYETSGSDAHTAQGGFPAEDVYFIDPYSKTYPMEDRARLMENLLSGRSPYEYCFSGSHVQEKLSFYFQFLRDTLGDENWPPRTAWEEALISASSGN